MEYKLTNNKINLKIKIEYEYKFKNCLYADNTLDRRYHCTICEHINRFITYFACGNKESKEAET